MVDEFALKVRSQKQATLMKNSDRNQEIEHPHFVKIFGVETNKHCSVIAMELAD